MEFVFITFDYMNNRSFTDFYLLYIVDVNKFLIVEHMFLVMTGNLVIFVCRKLCISLVTEI